MSHRHSYWCRRRMKLWSWWRHQVETLSALLPTCAGYSPGTGEFRWADFHWIFSIDRTWHMQQFVTIGRWGGDGECTFSRLARLLYAPQIKHCRDLHSQSASCSFLYRIVYSSIQITYNKVRVTEHILRRQYKLLKDSDQSYTCVHVPHFT